MDDCISRQAVIDAFEGELYSLSLFIKIQNLPSAQSEIVRCKDCKYWKQQTNFQGTPLSFGFCESDYMWRSLYGETYEVAHIDTDDDFYCGYAERQEDEVL